MGRDSNQRPQPLQILRRIDIDQLRRRRHDMLARAHQRARAGVTLQVEQEVELAGREHGGWARVHPTDREARPNQPGFFVIGIASCSPT